MPDGFHPAPCSTCEEVINTQYGLIWVCSSPDFAGRYPFGLKV